MFNIEVPTVVRLSFRSHHERIRPARRSRRDTHRPSYDGIPTKAFRKSVASSGEIFRSLSASRTVRTDQELERLRYRSWAGTVRLVVGYLKKEYARLAPPFPSPLPFKVVRTTVRWYQDMLVFQRPWVHGHLIDMGYYCHAGRQCSFHFIKFHFHKPICRSDQVEKSHARGESPRQLVNTMAQSGGAEGARQGRQTHESLDHGHAALRNNVYLYHALCFYFPPRDTINC